MKDVQQVGWLARLFNRIMGFLFRWGLAPAYGHELVVLGRKTGRVHTTPVNLLRYEGVPYLVAPRGETQWVKNVRALGEATLRRGSVENRYRFSEVDASARPPILALYLSTFRSQVQGFFSVKAGEPLEAFAKIASRHPVFQLIPLEAGRASG